jgi:hypothetical protein
MVHKKKEKKIVSRDRNILLGTNLSLKNIDIPLSNNTKHFPAIAAKMINILPSIIRLAIKNKST